jgi:hypothetical protein
MQQVVSQLVTNSTEQPLNIEQQQQQLIVELVVVVVIVVELIV